MAPIWQQLSDAVRAACAPAGLDLVQPFRVAWYNDAVDAAYRLPDFGRGGDALGLLVGNTRALWPRFLDALAAAPVRRESAHPLDDYVAEALMAALATAWAATAGAPRYEVRVANDPPPRRVALQRLAHVSGLGWLSPSHLNVHPVHGPWIALRAAIVVDVAGPAGAAPASVPPCGDCQARCLPAFEHALTVVADPVAAHEDIARHWRLWLAVRDACPVGRASRYDDDQLRYHYTKDRAALAPAK